MKLQYTIGVVLWLSSVASAQQFPSGFNCSKLTNDASRASCLRQSESSQNSITRFPPGFDCLKLTNEDARATCFSQQSFLSEPTRPESQRPSSQSPNPTAISPTPRKKADPVISSTGTGFFVSSVGHLISNSHVVEDCKRLVARRANGETFPLEVIATDAQNDLALLKSEAASRVAVFRTGSVSLGEPVVVYGFPLAGTLTLSGNLTTGAISGIAGLNNDPGKYQISAPVQPGSSGGAILDESGLVVGVVQSKLDALRAQRITGDIPQNINFGIKASVAQNFLETCGVRFSARRNVQPRKVSAIAAEAVQFSVLIACFQ